MKKVAILQSSYIPWKGYFDLINSVDEFILFDDVQFTKRDWRNRNIIKTAAGPQWLTIPCQVKGKFEQLIKDTMVVDGAWADTHWKSIKTAYAKSKNFKNFSAPFETLYHRSNLVSLSEINFLFIQQINSILGIKAKISWSMDYKVNESDPSKRLLQLCLKAGASDYISGPAAKEYLNIEIFNQAKISVTFFSYDNYKVYDQLFPPFEHKVTVLDLIFNEGENSINFLKTGKNQVAQGHHE